MAASKSLEGAGLNFPKPDLRLELFNTPALQESFAEPKTATSEEIL